MMCSNYRGISLLSAVGKVFVLILLNRLKTLAEKVLPETQCGFRPNRGTTDVVFCARQLQEKSTENNIDPFTWCSMTLKKLLIVCQERLCGRF